ncbi:hypothetical protein Cni_G12304 [Canna indica]|uniref:Uncharacterized protein n=1 Tax=Canna indica TaxID=4628 RepID=A0AAQ3QAF8_9LILI|nr:hypothetical protein Cni_G12304 [Canna indica]
MGCGASKVEEPPLVALCRERRELIRAAAEHRFALAAAHAAYFRALGRVGDALHRFVQEELVSAPASPVLTLPPSEGKGKVKSKIEKSVGESGNADAVGASASSFASITHSHSDESHMHSHSDECHLHSYSDESDRHLHSDSESDEITGESSGLDGGGEESGRSFSHQPFYDAPIPNYYYMKSASTISSTTVYQDAYPAWSNTAYVGYGYGYGYGYPMGGAPMDTMQPPPVQDDNFYYRNQPQRDDKPADPPPPPPPPPEESTWDFFNPFDLYEQMIPGYFQATYRGGSVTSSPNSSEVREKEGIPDLEEETEQESVKSPVKERKGTDKDVSGSGRDSTHSSKRSSKRKDKDASGSERDSTQRRLKGADKEATGRVSVERSSDVVATEQETSGKKDTVLSQVKEESQGSYSVSKAEEDAKEITTKNKSVSFRDETSLATHDNRPSKESGLFAHGTRDVMEVVEEIKEHFESAANCGEEVSKMLEVGKFAYRSKNKILRVIFSRILNPVILPVRTTSRPSSTNTQHLTASSVKVKQANHAVCENMDIDTRKLSSTLEKLYIWEKRLHKIVEEEERLRVIYEREWKQLKALDESGAESLKIESTQASIRNLLTKLNIVIRSANHISSRINKIRDEELRPQLIELIQGLVKMWKSVLDCHHKQFEAIIESKSYNLVARTGSSVAKSTMELEMELLNWRSCFSNWVDAQKAYIETLNGWLLKWLLQETEETPDGPAPFSPSRIGAPDAFVIANDWYHSVEGISEDAVIDSMHTFAVNVHRLWETQDEEQRQKLRAEYLSKDFARKLKSLQKENGMDLQDYALDKTVLPISNGDEAFHHEHKMSLDAIKRQLDEERAKHEETIKKVHQATASNLRMGLAPIFQALESFSSGTLKGYEGIRISNGNVGT